MEPEPPVLIEIQKGLFKDVRRCCNNVENALLEPITLWFPVVLLVCNGLLYFVQ